MKLRFIVLFSLLFVFMLYGSCSFAYTIDDFISFTGQVKELNSNFTTCCNQILNNSERLKTDLSSYNPTTFIVTNANWTASFNTTILRFRSTPIKIDISTNQINIQSAYQNRSQWYEALFLNGVWQVSTASSNIQSCSNTSTFGLIDLDNQSFDNWYNNYFNGKFIPPYNGPVFTPSNNGIIQVIASNNLSENMLRLPFTYTGQTDWTLGYLTDFDNVYSIFGYFGPLFYREGQLYTESYQNEFNYNINTGVFNGGLIFDPSTGRISIRRESLVNKQGYNFLLRYRLTNLDEVQDIDDLNYYAYFYNLNITSGDLISPEINSSVDIGMVNALDDFLNNNPNEQYYYDNSFFMSGDFWSVSGDLFGISYRSYDNFGLHSFIRNTFSNFITFLTNNSNISINFGFLGIWNSSQFVMPQNSFTSLVSIVANGLLVLYAGFALYRFFNLLSTFDLDSLTNTDEVMNWF